VVIALAACAVVAACHADPASAYLGELAQKPGVGACISGATNDDECSHAIGLRFPEGVAVSPDGRDVYVASFYAGLAAFDRDAATGALDQQDGAAACFTDPWTSDECTAGRALDGAIDVAVSPDGQNVYVAAARDDALAVFDRDPESGALIQKAGSAGCVWRRATSESCAGGNGLRSASQVTVSPDGNSVYVAASYDSSVATFSRDQATGVLSQEPGSAGCILSPVDPHDLDAPCAPARAVGGPGAVAISPDGKSAYIPARGSNAVAVFDRDPASGALNQKTGTAGCISETGSSGTCIDGVGLSSPSAALVSPDGENVYVAAGDTVAVFDRDQATGALTQKAGSGACISQSNQVAPCAAATGGLGLAARLATTADGRNIYVASVGSNAVAVLDRDLDTGVLSQRPGSAACIAGNAKDPACAEGVGLVEPRAVAVSPDGQNVYTASNSGVAVFDRDDGISPTASIETGPSGTIDYRGPTFTFTSDKSSSTFECRIDGADYTPCASPVAYSGLAEGSHRFNVRATDTWSNVGNAAAREFVVDVPPASRIDSGPAGVTSGTSASFSFSSDDPAARFECRLDEGEFAPCESPRSYADLTAGPHTFHLRAVDEGRATGPEVSRDFVVDEPPAITGLVVAPKAIVAKGDPGAGRRSVIKLAVSEDSTVRFRIGPTRNRDRHGRSHTTFSRSLPAGKSSIPFSAILRRSDLRSGRFVLTARATDDRLQRSAPATTRFRIKRA